MITQRFGNRFFVFGPEIDRIAHGDEPPLRTMLRLCPGLFAIYCFEHDCILAFDFDCDPALLDAVNKTHGIGVAAPTYRDFVRVHVRAMTMSDPEGMSWGVHTMPGMSGRNFLAWHRWFVRQMEKRLRKVHASIVIPYWDAITDRAIPAALTKSSLLTAWGITRNWRPAVLAHASDLTAAMAMGTFPSFQATLEGVVHGSVHNAVGGDMATASSPADPLFWLHHANLDRLWSEWQVTHAGQNPGNPNEVLQPTPIFGVKVSKTRTTGSMGYRYA